MMPEIPRPDLNTQLWQEPSSMPLPDFANIRANPLPVPVTQLDMLKPHPWELGSMALLVMFYLVVQTEIFDINYDFVNITGALWFAATLFAGALRMVGIEPIALWTGLFWLRISTAVYFGLGSVVQYTFSTSARVNVDSFYLVLPDMLLRVNLICAVSMLVFLVTNYAAAAFGQPQSYEEKASSKDNMLWYCALIFGIIGYSVKYFIQIPYVYGLLGNVPIPGIILALADLSVAGLFLLTLYCVQYAPVYLFIPTALLFMDVLTGTLQFSKGQALLPAIVYILALLRYKASRVRLMLAAVPVLFLFQVLVPAVQYGRSELLAQYGNIDTGSLSDRLEILTNYVYGNTAASQFAQSNDMLERFYYASAMAAAVVQHDSGQNGESLKDVFTVFIPRFLWPNKPVYNVGARFNLAVANNPDSASWMGTYIEAYWNLGWAGLPIVLIPLALAYWVLGRLTLVILKQAKWLHFPVVFLAAFVAMRIDGDIVTTQVVSIVLCFVLYFAATMADKWLGGLFSKAGREAGRSVSPDRSSKTG